MDDLLHKLDSIRKRLEGEPMAGRLEVREEQIDSIVASCVRYLIVELATGEILRASALAESMFGYITGELAGHSIHELLPERLRDAHRVHLKAFSEAPRNRLMGMDGMNLLGRCRDGSEIAVAIELYPHAWDGKRCAVATIMPVRSAS